MGLISGSGGSYLQSVSANRGRFCFLVLVSTVGCYFFILTPLFSTLYPHCSKFKVMRYLGKTVCFSASVCSQWLSSLSLLLFCASPKTWIPLFPFTLALRVHNDAGARSSSLCLTAILECSLSTLELEKHAWPKASTLCCKHHRIFLGGILAGAEVFPVWLCARSRNRIKILKVLPSLPETVWFMSAKWGE